MGLSGRESSDTEERIKREKEQARDKERPTGIETSTYEYEKQTEHEQG